MQALPAAAWHKACSSIKELPPRPLRQPAAGGDGEKPRAARKSGRNSPFGSGGGSTLQRQEQGGKARGAAGGPRAVGQGKGSAEPSRTGLRARRVLTPERARASCASASVRCVRKPGEGGEGGCVQLGKPLAFLKHFFFFKGIYQGKGGKRNRIPPQLLAPPPSSLRAPHRRCCYYYDRCEGTRPGGVRTPRPSPHPPAAAGGGRSGTSPALSALPQPRCGPGAPEGNLERNPGQEGPRAPHAPAHTKGLHPAPTPLRAPCATPANGNLRRP